MRRVVSVWFPHWPTDRLRRRLATPPDDATPLVTALHDGRKRVLAAIDSTAASRGLRPGMPVAQALALVPGLEIKEAQLDSDAEALHRLALWCHALTPLAAPCPPDGLWLDMTGGIDAPGEAPLLRRLLARLASAGLHARAAMADTLGAAHALARYGGNISVAPPGRHPEALASLPIACLRIPTELEATLRRLGFDQVAHLARIPRPLLARRFGTLPSLRLDQAHGLVEEPIGALAPEHPLQHRLAFVEPLLRAESFQAVIPRLVALLCTDMERLGLGARQLDLLFERVDGHVAAIRVGAAQPSRDAAHLVRLLVERLETLDPGLGIDAMRLVAPIAQPLHWEQRQDGTGHPVAQLVDRLINRLGPKAVYRTTPTQSDIPERMTQREDAGTLPPPEHAPETKTNTPHPPLPLPPLYSPPEQHGMPEHLQPSPPPQSTPHRHHTPSSRNTSPPRQTPQQPSPAERRTPALHLISTPHGNHLQGNPQATTPPPITSDTNARDESTRLHGALHHRTQRNHLRLIERTPSSLKSHTAPSKQNPLKQTPLTPDSLTPDPLTPDPLTPNSLIQDSLIQDSLTQYSLTQDPLTQDPPSLPWLPRPDPIQRSRTPAKPWPNRLHAPARLLTPPRPVKAIAALPDRPPIAFTWRRRHVIHRAEGPERIFGEWWQAERETGTIRDYFIVEDNQGQRFWLFRRGNGTDLGSGDLEWFLHGLF